MQCSGSGRKPLLGCANGKPLSHMSSFAKRICPSEFVKICASARLFHPVHHLAQVCMFTASNSVRVWGEKRGLDSPLQMSRAFVQFASFEWYVNSAVKFRGSKLLWNIAFLLYYLLVYLDEANSHINLPRKLVVFPPKQNKISILLQAHDTALIVSSFIQFCKWWKFANDNVFFVDDSSWHSRLMDILAALQWLYTEHGFGSNVLLS